MATVRTSAPRGPDPGNKRKRKRTGKEKDASASSAGSDSAAVQAQLTTLEHWHRALTIDMKELRREGARVRVELEKVDDTAEAAVERSERCAAQAQAAQERAQAASQAKDEAVKDLKSQLQSHKTEMEKLQKKLERQRKSSINEEYLMTQLSELQEQYENELAKVREDHDATLAAQHKQLKAMERALVKLQEGSQHKKQLENTDKMLQALRDENSRLNQKLAQLPTRQEVQALQQQLEVMERDNQDEQGRTRTDLNVFEDKLADVDRRMVDVLQKVDDVDRKVDEVGARPVAPSMGPIPPPRPLPPPPLPRDLVRQGELAGIHDALRRVNRDFQAVGADMTSLAKRVEARGTQQEQHVETRLQELSTQLYDALGHDSRKHSTEISRLKDAVFDVQSDHREFGQKMRRLEDEVQQVTAARGRSRSPPRDRTGGGGAGWRYGQAQAPLLPTPTPTLPPAPPESTYRNRRDRPSRYEPAPDYHDPPAPSIAPPPPDWNRWTPRRRSRSRSRSPSRRPPWAGTGSGSFRGDSGSTPALNDRPYPRETQRFNSESSNGGDPALPRSNGADVPASRPSLSTASTPSSRGGSRTDTAEETARDHPSLPFRRSRQPRSTPEVIVIEEDDDDDDDDENGEQGDERAAPAPSSGHPDVVLDEEGSSQSSDVVMVAPPARASTSADHVESTDLLEKEADLQTGFLLYFCLGGAPDLDVQWTTCFSQLNADECVAMPRALRFQRRYGFLQMFPVYLTQCILQAVIVNAQNAPEGSSSSAASQPTGALNASTMQSKFDDVVKDIHLSWAKSLVKYLSKQASSMDELASEKLELSVNPAGLSSADDKDGVIYEWSRRQEAVMWILARKLHYGSFLPAMKCNVDASPAVYLFTLMFDVLTVTSECPQFGSFRLNAFGAKLMAFLWEHTLKQLPYVFFADWSWLDDQSTKEKLPALGFCHLLASILLWNSAIDRHSLTNSSIYADAVKHMLTKLYVGGQRAVKSMDTDSSPLQLGECEATPIELLDLDSKFASMLGLDGFFEVTEAIQNNMLAVAAAAKANSED